MSYENLEKIKRGNIAAAYMSTTPSELQN